MIGAAEKHYRAEVVRPEVLLDEPPYESPRAEDLLAPDLIERDHIQPAFGLIVGLHIGLDGICREQRSLGSSARNVDETEGRDRLRSALFENLEIVSGQVGDHVAACVGDRGIDLDRLDLHAEGWLLGSLCNEDVRAAYAREQGNGDSRGHETPVAQAGEAILTATRRYDVTETYTDATETTSGATVAAFRTRIHESP